MKAPPPPKKTMTKEERRKRTLEAANALFQSPSDKRLRKLLKLVDERNEI